LVDKRANKFTLKKIIEYLFHVEILKINTLKVPHKKTISRKPHYKKAVITLKYGGLINLFPEM
jgi:large subunit ribosomal protein L23